MSAPDGWKACKRGSCRMWEKCLYSPCLNAAPPAPAAATVPDPNVAEIARLRAAANEADAALDEADDRFSRIADWATNTGIAAQDETDWRERMKIIAALAGCGDGGEGV